MAATVNIILSSDKAVIEGLAELDITAFII